MLLVSFGGPERTDDVIPFLENVLSGENVPRERMLKVAEHYYHFVGKSPITEQHRALIAALECELHPQGPAMPIYCGNRNWHVRTFHDNLGFIQAMAHRVREALNRISDDRRAAEPLLFTAHSIRISMAETSPYAAQLLSPVDSCRKPWADPGALVYQSRSGPPIQP